MYILVLYPDVYGYESMYIGCPFKKLETTKMPQQMHRIHKPHQLPYQHEHVATALHTLLIRSMQICCVHIPSLMCVLSRLFRGIIVP